jgi:hypothetical protein
LNIKLTKISEETLKHHMKGPEIVFNYF